MELINRDKRDGYVYDVIIKQYDTTYWKTITGTPSVSSNNLQFNAAGAGSYLLHIFAEIEFMVTVPAVPTSGDSRQFGLYSPSMTTTRGAIYFNVTGTAFSLHIYDDAGNNYSLSIPWQSAWTNSATAFKIRWESDGINVYVGGTLLASIAPSSIAIPSNALPVYINNGNSDNMLVSYILVHRAAAII